MSEIVFSACGAEWPTDLDIDLCGKCGNELDTAHAEITDKERRTLTVLFADLSGLTDTPDSRDPEHMEAIVHDLYADLGAVVESYDGYVDKYMGDVMMAVFGAPEAHEDDPLRAVRTAFDFQETVAEYNEEHGENLALSIGINHGTVVWSQVGGREYTVTGDAVNVAQRLEDQADPGEILVARPVEKRTRDRVRYVRQLVQSVKGREASVQPYLAEELQLYEPEEVDVVETPAFGRDSEITRLINRYEDSDPRFLVITGEAGIGKSRLVEAYEEHLVDLPIVIIYGKGHCLQHTDQPYEPFGDILLDRAEIGRGNPDAGELVVEKVLEELGESEYHESRRKNIADLMAISAGLEVADARVAEMPQERIQEETFLAWLAWIRQHAQTNPVLLIFEDIQWMDEASFELLEFLAARLDAEADDLERSVNLLGTTRPSGDVPSGYETVDLQPLTVADTRAISEAILEQPVSAALPEYLHERVGGNPYFLKELLQYLRENDLLERGDVVSLTHESALEDAVPETLMGLLVGRIDALGDEPRETLKAASIVGSQFWTGILEEILPFDPTESIERLEARKMIRARPESTIPGDEEYEFTHTLLRDAAYELLPRATRQELHTAISRELDSVARSITPPSRSALRLAGHQAQYANHEERAYSLWTEVAQLALDENANQEAIKDFERCVALASESDIVTAAKLTQLRVLLAKAYETAGKYGQAQAVVDAALAGAGEDDAIRAQLLSISASVTRELGDWEKTYQVTDQLQAIAVALNRADLESAAFYERGWAALYLGEYSEALDCHETGVKIARKSDNKHEEAMNLKGVGNVHWQRGDYDEARTFYERGLALAQETDSKTLVRTIRNNLGVVTRMQGELEQAQELFEHVLVINREHGDRTGESTNLLNLGEIARYRGDYDSARAYLKESLEIASEIGRRLDEVYALQYLGTVATKEGAYDRAASYYQDGLEIARAIENPSQEANCLVGLGTLAVHAGEFDDARKKFEAALAIFEAGGEQSKIARVELERGRLELATGDPETARQSVQDARTIYSAVGQALEVGRCHKVLGEIADTTGDDTTAIEHWLTTFDTFADHRADDEALETARNLLEVLDVSDSSVELEGLDDRIQPTKLQERIVELYHNAPDATRSRHSWINRLREDIDAA